MMLLTGCASSRLSTVQVTHFSADGSRQVASQSFEQAFYRRDAAGQLQVALCSRAAVETDPTQTITQIVLIGLSWHPHPGKTLAERTMTDAIIKYALINGPHAVCYEGAGFVSFKQNARTGELRGWIESAHLSRRRTRGKPADIFGGQARLVGEFLANSSALDVTRLTREADITLGPPQP